MLDQQHYIIFKAPDKLADLNQQSDDLKILKFAIGSFNTKLVSRILVYNGVSGTSDEDFSLLWATSPEVDSVPPLSPFHKINHFPFSKQIVGNKAELAYIIQNHECIKEFDQFFPTSYILPDDRDMLFMKMKANPRKSFIAKPPEGSCGHGIKIVTFNDFYTIQHDAVVSEYVDRPLTIDSFKFDLRIYVLVTSFAPLRAFVYKEGLARFATESYNIGKENVFSQLTNATLNKRGRNWVEDFKWKLSDLLFELEHRFKISYDEVMNKILDTVAKTLALVQPTMAPDQRKSVMNPFFELYGFDLLIDRDFKMWILEINTNPAMGFDQDEDFEVKGPLLASALSIAGIPNLSSAELSEISVPQDMPVEKIEAEIILKEDERNEQSGNGFIRIFPSENTDYLTNILKVPPLEANSPIKQDNKDKKHCEKKAFNPKKLGQLLTPEQSSEILLEYLVKTERRARKEGDELEQERLRKFFVSQGYKLRRKTTLKTILSLFIEDVRSSYKDDDFDMPDTLRKMIIGSNEDYIEAFLKNTKYCFVKNIDDLF